MALTTSDHPRDAAGFTYVYPVLSRRAGGVSVGINLNPNNACNWRCVYCQVSGLVRGAAPVLDTLELRRELFALLEHVVRGDFLARNVPEPEMRRLNDIAFSGNGEPTSSPQLREALDVVAQALDAFDLSGAIGVVLITNGSLVGRPGVNGALERLAGLGGEVWFKLDTATREGFRRINDTPIDPARHLQRLRECALLCPTWIQTCVFARDGQAPDEAEQVAYFEALAALVAEQVPVRGVLVYGLARPSCQPEAPSLSALSAGWLEAFAGRIEALGLTARVHA